MAIAVLSTTTGTGAATSSSFDVPMTISDAGAVLFVGVGRDQAGDNNPVLVWDSTTANSSFTLISEVSAPGRYVSLWQLVNPSTGDHSITLSGWSTGAGNGVKSVLAVAYSGVDSTTPSDTATISQFSTSASSLAASTAVPSAAGDLLLTVIAINAELSSNILALGGATMRAVSSNGTTFNMAMSEVPGGATSSSSFQWSTAADHSLIAVNINAAAGGASPSLMLRRRTLMGLGF